MAKGNTITFEYSLPNPEDQGKGHMTRDLGDDYSEYVVKSDGALWRVYDDYNHEPAPFSFTGVVEFFGTKVDYRAVFNDGRLVGKVEVVMYLYCVTNGWTGESYVRVYVWASSEEEALQLARDSFYEHRKSHHDATYWERLMVHEIMRDNVPAFATKPSDSGFNDEGY